MYTGSHVYLLQLGMPHTFIENYTNSNFSLHTQHCQHDHYGQVLIFKRRPGSPSYEFSIDAYEYKIDVVKEDLRTST